MAEPIAVFTTAPVSDQAFQHFLQTIGAYPARDGWSEGQLSDVDRHVWIERSPESLTELEQDGTPAEHAAIKQRLGGWPATCILLNISRTPGSDRLAMQFILAFIQHWPVLVDDGLGHLYTSADVRALYEAGGSFEDALRDPLQV